MTPAQCRGARAMLSWRQSDLADTAGLKSYMPILYYEKLGDVTYETHIGPRRRISASAIAKITAAFEKAGIEFLGDTGLNMRIVE
jgi:hypothetical protein